MRAAQALYEGIRIKGEGQIGLITYMRTDSMNLSGEAVKAVRGRIDDLYGKDFLTRSVRQFDNKSKGAQEAHEAIRPAGTEMKTVDELGLSGPEWRLYDLIWKRTMASQMASAEIDQTAIVIQPGDGGRCVFLDLGDIQSFDTSVSLYYSDHAFQAFVWILFSAAQAVPTREKNTQF